MLAAALAAAGLAALAAPGAVFARDGTNALSNLELLCSRCHALVS